MAEIISDHLKFVRVEKKSGELDGYQPSGSVRAGEELHLAAALEIVAKELRMNVENVKRTEPLTPKQVHGIAEATVLLQEVISDFIYLDPDEAKEVIKKIKLYMENMKRGQ